MPARYGDHLSIATEAIQTAGQLLRAEFLRPGGPRGGGEQAALDWEAEWVIRDRLMGATSGWGYLGKMTVTQNGSEGHHVWVVDPHNGVSGYVQGFRGSAISIGLLRDGEPVLGVVYAPLVFGNEGDLVAWAEGCGPLLRNGRPVERAAWPCSLDANTVVLVTWAADRAPGRMLKPLAPGRYRTCPSMAYRLALVACGEGDVAIALDPLNDHSYAAGHALVRSCGGELLNESGEPVTYADDGKSVADRCFGGAPVPATKLAQRDWAADAEEQADGRAAIGLSWDDCPRRFTLPWPDS